jgi:Zn-dependent protease with chaperone function
MTRRPASRHLESSALTAVLPAAALVPACALALALIWLPVQVWWDVPYWLFAGGFLAAGVLLFLRPFQRLVLTRLLGARRPTRAELDILEPVWRSVTQSVHVPARRFVLAVLDADELNAFASGGHLVVVTSYAVEVLPDGELAGVLAHELSHHLGLHTIALTVAQWLSLPIVLLARIGFLLQNIARAATDTFARGSSGITIVGRIVSGVLNVVAWLFLAAILTSTAIGNLVGRSAEFQADRRVTQMGFGPHLAAALRRFVDSGLAERPARWQDRLFASHPPARTRVARIDALLRTRPRSRPPRPR